MDGVVVTTVIERKEERRKVAAMQSAVSFRLKRMPHAMMLSSGRDVHLQKYYGSRITLRHLKMERGGGCHRPVVYRKSCRTLLVPSSSFLSRLKLPHRVNAVAGGSTCDRSVIDVVHHELAPNIMFDTSTAFEASVQIIYLALLVIVVGGIGYVGLQQLLIRRELDNASKDLQEKVRTGEATAEVRSPFVVDIL